MLLAMLLKTKTKPIGADVLPVDEPKIRGSRFLQEKGACCHCGVVDWQYPSCPSCKNGKPLRAEGFSCNQMFESIHFVCDTCHKEVVIHTKYDLEFMKDRGLM